MIFERRVTYQPMPPSLSLAKVFVYHYLCWLSFQRDPYISCVLEVSSSDLTKIKLDSVNTLVAGICHSASEHIQGHFNSAKHEKVSFIFLNS